MKVGFIGLGAMGRAMAANLVKAGHEVRVWNRSAGAVEALVRQGAHAVASPAEAFSGDAVVSMFADDGATREVVLASGVLDRMVPPAVHVNLATISASLAKELSAAHAARVPMPFAGVLRDNHLDAIAHGAGELDWAALAQVAERRAGLGEPASATSAGSGPREPARA